MALTKIRILVVMLAMLVSDLEALELQPVLAGRPFLAVILPPENARETPTLCRWFSDFWMPTVAEVAMAEKKIAEFFSVAETNQDPGPNVRKRCVLIRDHPDRYIRQYVGGVRDGRRVIFCFGNRLGPEYTGKHDDWRRTLIYYIDAGITFQIDYDMQDGVCRKVSHDMGY